MKPKRLIVHHSASALSTTIADIREWHLARGFSDIGYHAIIEADGALRYGRPLWVQGAHDAGQNADSLGICLVGNNTIPRHIWTLDQEEQLIRVMRACRLLYGPDFGFEMHREHEPDSPTECPGITEIHWGALLESGSLLGL